MQTTKKKPSFVFIFVGAVFVGYLGYLINGAWTEGMEKSPSAKSKEKLWNRYLQTMTAGWRQAGLPRT